VYSVNNGTGYRNFLEFYVAFKRFIVKSPSLKIVPKLGFLGSASQPKRKFIFALVDGIYGSKTNDNKRMKLQITEITISVLRLIKKYLPD
jgi:hypothetical protein